MEETNKFLIAALQYARNGWRVFPAKADKSPYVTWSEEATTDETQIREWWAKWPNANVAIVCGTNPETDKALVVIDVDVKNNACGDDVLAQWAETHGWELPETVTVNTATNGYHYYFGGELAKAVGMGNGQDDFKGIDIRGKSSYVLAPPSETNTGTQPYTWAISWDEQPLTPIDTDILAFTWCVLGKKYDPFSSKRVITHFELPEKIPVGSRNDTLHRYASSLQAKKLPDEMIFNAVWDCNIARCEPSKDGKKLSEAEVRKTVNGVLTSYKKGTSFETSEQPEQEHEESVSYSHEIASIKLPEVIQGALYQSNVCLLSGPSKVGKTFLVSELAVAVASGTQWLKWQCTRGNVLIIDGEMELSELLKRYEDICDRLNLDRDETLSHIHYYEEKGKAEGLNNLKNKYITEAKRLDCNLIILDPAYPFMTGDENNAGDVRTFTNCVNEIAKKADAAMLYLQHHGKAAQGDRAAINRASGSGMFGRTPDLIIDTIEITQPTVDDTEYEYPAFRIDVIARYFQPVDVYNVWFKKPLHVLDDTGKLDNWQPAVSGQQKGGITRGKQNTENKQQNKDRVLSLIETKTEEDSSINKSELIKAAVNEIGVSSKTIQNYLTELEDEGAVSIYTTKKNRGGGFIKLENSTESS